MVSKGMRVYDNWYEIHKHVSCPRRERVIWRLPWASPFQTQHQSECGPHDKPTSKHKKINLTYRKKPQVYTYLIFYIAEKSSGIYIAILEHVIIGYVGM